MQMQNICIALGFFLYLYSDEEMLSHIGGAVAGVLRRLLFGARGRGAGHAGGSGYFDGYGS